MVSTPDELLDNSPIAVGTLVTLKKPSARKLLSQFLELLVAKQKSLSVECELLEKPKVNLDWQ